MAYELSAYSQQRVTGASIGFENQRLKLIEEQIHSWRVACADEPTCADVNASESPCVRSPVQLYGERNSGTNYIERLMVRNFHGITGKYGFKHMFRLNTSTDEMERRVKQAVSAGVPVVVLMREPFAWLLSMNKHPYAEAYDGMPLDAFARASWHADGEEATNILALRTRKYAALRRAITAVGAVRPTARLPPSAPGARSPLALALRYEDARDDPIRTVCKLRCALRLCTVGPHFVPVVETVGAGRGVDGTMMAWTDQPFQRGSADPLIAQQLRGAEEEKAHKYADETHAFVVSQLSPRLEEWFGYDLSAWPPRPSPPSSPKAKPNPKARH